MEHRFDLQLIGPFRLAFDGSEVALPPQSERVIAFVALARAPVRRAVLSGSLWPLRTNERASSALRAALWQVTHRAPGLIGPPGLTGGQRASIELSPRASSDVDRFAAATEGRDASLVDIESIVATSPDDLLPYWDEDWLHFEREQFRQRRLHALDRLSRALAEEGEYGAAIEVGLAAIAIEPLRESAHRAVIEAHLAEGNLNEARRQLQRCRALLNDQLGLEPSADLVSRVETSMAAQRPDRQGRPMARNGTSRP